MAVAGFESLPRTMKTKTHTRPHYRQPRWVRGLWVVEKYSTLTGRGYAWWRGTSRDSWADDIETAACYGTARQADYHAGTWLLSERHDYRIRQR